MRAERGPDFPAPRQDLLDPPPPGWPEDARSTSGPIPPQQAARAALSAPSAAAAQVVLTDVPAYMWRDGCGPTSAGMVIGYWDGKGFDNLVGGSAAAQTTDVNNMISSAGHYSDYALPKDSYPANPYPLPDKSEPPIGDEHIDNSIADFMHTSQSARDLYYGWSWWSDMPIALTAWVHLVAPPYNAIALNQYWGTFTWEGFKAEIDSGRPVVLLVDSDSDGSTDHFVTAMGYSDDGVNRLYAARNTWNYGVNWYTFAPMASGRPFGIYGATLFRIQQQIPGGFYKLSPGNGASGLGTTATLAWTSSSGATSYEYCYYDVSTSPCGSTWPSTTNTSVHLGGLSNGATYRWQVRARNAAGTVDANGGTWWQWTASPVLPRFLPMITKQ